MQGAVHMTEVVLPTVMSRLSQHTLQSFSANANAQNLNLDRRGEPAHANGEPESFNDGS